MTREQVETEMAQYRTIFTVVRLLDAAQVGGEESINSFCSCYSYWGKNTPCRNCISRQVLEDHRQRTKLEYMGSEVFQVTAVYREVDGVPCVMELIQKLDGETLIDPENGDRLIDSIASYHTKLYHDALTDSYNRLYFEDALKEKTDPAGVAVLDLDDFKLINDTYGHQAGDIALRTCVDVVRACIRKSDVLIRYGGDEFLLVLPGIERAAFLAKLDRIREQLHTASVPGYSRLQLSASIGGVITQPGETVEQAVSRADKLMYQAKNRKNMVVTEDNARDGALSAAGREGHSRQSILIVDDSEMNRAILAEILGSDYNILEAANGKECLAMLEQYGTGCSGSRFLNGTLEMHLELEAELARFLRKPGVVTFGTGFQSNVGIISALVDRHDYVICDRENHASIYAGCQLSYGKMLRYRHSDMAELEKMLQRVPEKNGALIVTDGVFSMGGDIAKLPEICALAKKYGARVMVDDAHGLGVLGEGGRGTASYFGLEDQVDVYMGTFSKSLASLGGYMAASEEVADYVRHVSRPFIFSASIPPANCATALAALRHLEAHPELPERLRALSLYARRGMTDRGLKIRESALTAPTPIIPIYTYETYHTLEVARDIYDRGVYVNPTLPPATPEGEALLRTSYMATHTEALLDEAMDIMADVLVKDHE